MFACVCLIILYVGSCVSVYFCFGVCECVCVCGLLREPFRSVRSSDAAEAVVSSPPCKSVVMSDLDAYAVSFSFVGYVFSCSGFVIISVMIICDSDFVVVICFEICQGLLRMSAIER